MTSPDGPGRLPVRGRERSREGALEQPAQGTTARGVSPPALSVVVPAYDEEARIGRSLRLIRTYLEGHEPAFEVIVVDDGSSDGTLAAAGEAVGDDPRVRMIRLGRNRGKGAAVRAGVLQAKGDRILFSDADLSTPIEEIRVLSAALDAGIDVAFGSRAIRGSDVVVRQPFYRQTMGKAFNLFVRVLALPGVRDSQCGFKLFRREAAQEIFRRQRLDRFAFDVEVLFLARRLGFRLAEVPVRWINSPDSRVHPVRDSSRMALDLLRLRWRAWTGGYRS